jgi:UDP-3-O-[3-hydroxymyristoyl] glucosamine N-acyltransferase
MPHVTLVKRVQLGKRVRIHSGAVLGADGFGIAMHQGQWIKIAQLGGVQIGDDCEIGANTCIDRGAIEDTILEHDVRLDNHIQIGHNVYIGAHTAIAGCAAIAGSSRIGRYCLIGGAAGLVGHIELTDKVVIGAMSLVTHSITEPGEYASGTPLQTKSDWRKNAVRFKQLDQLARTVQTLKKHQDL